MKILQLIVSLLILQQAAGQQNSSISIIDFVKIKNDKRQETIFYYENNWKRYRDSALDKGMIKSYRIYTTVPDSAAHFDLLLITEFKDSSQYALREENFQKIMGTANPDGPKLMNNRKPAEFRQNLFFKIARTLFEGERK